MVIQVDSLTKRYGAITAVDDLSFDVESGAVTGFLGPNGAGKSTTMRVVLGLDEPTAGTTRVAGRRYRDLRTPMRTVGALLDAGAMHPGRTGRAHLTIAARSNGIPRSRVDEVLDQVGLTGAAGRRIKGYSLGMRQRLGIAAALLGDPPVLLFDEPVNGLDLDGVRWVRDLFRGFAAEGRTVLVSSHLMSEMQVVADRVVVVGRGQLVLDASVDQMLDQLGGATVLVRTAEPDRLSAVLPAGAAATVTGPQQLEVTGASAQALGDLAFAQGIPVHGLAEVGRSLEEAYLALTSDSTEYSADRRAGEAAS